MFQLQFRNPSRASKVLLFHRKRGIPLPHLLFDETLDGYRDHEVRESTLDDAAHQKLVEAADEVMTGAVMRIHIRGHADRVFVSGGRDTNDEKRTSARRARDVWRLLELNVTTRGFETESIIQVILEAVGALEPLDTSAAVNERNRRVEIFLFDSFEPPLI